MGSVLGPSTAAPASVHYRLAAKRSWFDFGVREIWRDRHLVRILGGRDIKLRYRQTALGVTGVVLGPLLNAGVLSFVFGGIANLPSEGVPYLPFAYSAFLGWTVFAGLVGRSSSVLVANVPLITKIYMPRLLLPISGIAVVLVDFCVASTPMIALMVIFGIVPGPEVVLLPLWLATLAAFGLGIGAALGAMMVHYRDVALATSIGLQSLLYVTPIAYSADAVPERFRVLYSVNPLRAPVEGLRWSLVGTEAPGLVAVTVSAALGVMVLVTGFAIFTRLERGFADVI